MTSNCSSSFGWWGALISVSAPMLSRVLIVICVSACRQIQRQSQQIEFESKTQSDYMARTLTPSHALSSLSSLLQSLSQLTCSQSPCSLSSSVLLAFPTWYQNLCFQDMFSCTLRLQTLSKALKRFSQKIAHEVSVPCWQSLTLIFVTGSDLNIWRITSWS